MSAKPQAHALQGDGAHGISGLSKVMAARRENIPVIAVVFNNNQWGADKKNQIDYYGNRIVGANLDNPDFAQTARNMGAEGFRVEESQGRLGGRSGCSGSAKAGGNRRGDRWLGSGHGRTVPPGCARTVISGPNPSEPYWQNVVQNHRSNSSRSAW